jgi:hypothetical protein
MRPNSTKPTAKPSPPRQSRHACTGAMIAAVAMARSACSGRQRRRYVPDEVLIRFALRARWGDRGARPATAARPGRILHLRRRRRAALENS